jgi:predicted deacylase
VWLTAGCHGDEVGGIVVVQEIFRRLRRNPLLKGILHAFPLMNPLGFEAGARNITFSKEDLNRSFPGNPTGTLAERIADTIFQSIIATGPDLVIDLHNDWIRSIPYAVLDAASGVDSPAHDVAGEVADACGFIVVSEPDPLRRTLSHSLIGAAVPALTIELGESFVVNETNVDYGVRSVFRILQHLGMLPADDTPFAYPLAVQLEGQRLTYSQTPVSATSGIIRFQARPGELVRQGQSVARIVNAFGRLQQTIQARHDAIVLGLADSAVAFPGAPVMAFGNTKEVAADTAL